MKYFVIDTGGSRSFMQQDPIFAGSTDSPNSAEIIIVIGNEVVRHTHDLDQWGGKAAVLLELGQECLGVHTGESRGNEGSNVVGFARFRVGHGQPSNLVEVVCQPSTLPKAADASRLLFESFDFKVAVCRDFSGRIIDRLVRPYFNAALRRLDEGLATADDLDTTLRLGLGYPEGPIALLERTGLEEHFRVTQALWNANGDPAFVPARRAQVAARRAERNGR